MSPEANDGPADLLDETVLIGADDVYLRDHASSAILSALDLGYRVHVVYAAGSDIALLRRNSAREPRLTYEPWTVPAGMATPQYYCCLRLLALPRVLQARGAVWIMDADAILRARFPWANGKSIMLYLNPLHWGDPPADYWRNTAEYHGLDPQWVYEGTRMTIGMSGFRMPDALPWVEWLAADVQRQLDEGGHDLWFVDQRSLYRAWLHHYGEYVGSLADHGFGFYNPPMPDVQMWLPTPDQRANTGPDADAWLDAVTPYRARWLNP